jgi:hypothetical protein
MKKFIIFVAAIAMVGAFTATGMAAEWNLYGSARMATFYAQDDPGGGADSVDNLQWAQQGNSRIGATVKFNDEIGGAFEMSDSFGKRKLYGTYNFEGGQILLGQTYTPATSFYSNSVYDGDGDLLGVGQFYTGRIPMIQLKMANFKLALIDPGDSLTLGGTATEVTFPKIEGAYKYKADQWFLDVFAGYQRYKELGTSIGDLDVDSWVVGLGGGFNFGAAYLKAGIHISENQGNYGVYNPAGMLDEAVILGDQLIDNDGFGWLVVLGYKVSDSMTIEAGYGAETNELDATNSQKDETTQVYANLSYTITPGFFIVPEIGLIDRKDNALGVDQGDVSYAGLKWQINF